MLDNAEKDMTGTRPNRSDSMPAGTIATASSAVVTDTAKAECVGVTENSVEKTGSSPWTYQSVMKVAIPAANRASVVWR